MYSHCDSHSDGDAAHSMVTDRSSDRFMYGTDKSQLKMEVNRRLSDAFHDEQSWERAIMKVKDVPHRNTIGGLEHAFRTTLFTIDKKRNITVQDKLNMDDKAWTAYVVDLIQRDKAWSCRDPLSWFAFTVAGFFDAMLYINFDISDGEDNQDCNKTHRSPSTTMEQAKALCKLIARGYLRWMHKLPLTIRQRFHRFLKLCSLDMGVPERDILNGAFPDEVVARLEDVDGIFNRCCVCGKSQPTRLLCVRIDGGYPYTKCPRCYQKYKKQPPPQGCAVLRQQCLVTAPHHGTGHPPKPHPGPPQQHDLSHQASPMPSPSSSINTATSPTVALEATGPLAPQLALCELNQGVKIDNLRNHILRSGSAGDLQSLYVQYANAVVRMLSPWARQEADLECHKLRGKEGQLTEKVSDVVDRVGARLTVWLDKDETKVMWGTVFRSLWFDPMRAFVSAWWEANGGDLALGHLRHLADKPIGERRLKGSKRARKG